MLMKYFPPAIFAVVAIFAAILLLGSASAWAEKIVVTDFALNPAQKNSKQLPRDGRSRYGMERLMFNSSGMKAGMRKCFG